MGILTVKQTTKNGSSKQWKIDTKQKRRTFGTSRKANIVSIDPNHAPIQAVFQHKNNVWSLIHFDVKASSASHEIKDGLSLPLLDSTLSFKITEAKEFIAQDLMTKDFKGSQQKKILLVSRNERLLKTEVKGTSEKFFYSINGVKHTLPFQGSHDWEHLDIEGFEFKSRLINVDDLSNIAKLNPQTMVDRESKKMAVLIFGATLLFMCIGLLGGKKDEAPVVQKLNLPQSMVVKIEPKREKKKVTQGSQTAQKTVAQNAPATAAGASSPNKVKALLKGAIGARISQLIGKVSATDARTANVIAAAQGVKAGSGPSGRALAAVGNVESSGRNWTGEAVGTGTGKVGTAGIGGGNGTAGLGNSLASGGTGSGGVGLIEEESEVEGGLDREIIAQYIKTQLGQILYCYERQLSANPNLYGKVAVKFTISETGQVVAQNIGDTTLKSQPVEGCILNKVAKWKFPEPKGGTKVVVTYPFLFKSTN